MAESIHDRIEKLIKANGLSVREAERLCGLSDGTLRKFFKNPEQQLNGRTLDLIAKGLGVSVGYLLTGEDSAAQEAAAPLPAVPIDAHFNTSVSAPSMLDLPKNIEVRGTAAGSHHGGAFQFSGDTIEYVRRPPSLLGARDVYALYVEGSSMEPQYSPGDLLYVHPHRPARPGDPIVIQTKISEHEVEGTIGIYIKQTADYILIRKHNPHAEIKVPRNDGTKIHKIMTLNELFGV